MFKKSYAELKASHEIGISEAEFNAQKELEEMEARLDPKPKHVFGNAIQSTSYCDHPLGKFISREL